MIKYSDNAAPDYLIARIGDPNLRQTISEMGLRGQEQPLSVLGMFLTWNNHEHGALSVARLVQLLRMNRTEYRAEVARLQSLFQDPNWRATEFQWRLAGGANEDLRLEAVAVETLAPKGTARDYARIMAGVVTGTLLSPEVAAVMRRHLEWVLPGFDQLFSAFGTKGGSFRTRVLTDANFYIPRVGDFAGRQRVSVLFMRRMPLSVFGAFSTTGAHQVFEIGLALDRAFAERVRQSLRIKRRLAPGSTTLTAVATEDGR